MSTFIEKDINFGPKYVEHVYRAYPEHWSGLWMKVNAYLLKFTLFCASIV